MGSLTFTQLIHQGRQGNVDALCAAYDLVATPLRRIAARLLDRERPGQTLQPTALVNEFYLRLLRMECGIQSRKHFLGLATRSMRHLLIDLGRSKSLRRRREPEVLAAQPWVARPLTPEQIAARQVWDRLRQQDAVAAEAFWLLKVEGMTINEIASIQQRPAWRVVEDSDFALEFMCAKLR